ncbi:MAG TPA: hypothetical protein VHE35_17440, partial [Kofleriaceae bacterium]|nr:hypothetical protein [Kofleriaceae bacterium]
AAGPRAAASEGAEGGGAGAAAGPARPATLADLWKLLDDELAEARAALTPPPPPVPVTWKARRVASLDLGAPLLALAVGDLDGDGRGELVALTERAVVVMSPARHGLVEKTRIAVPAEPAIVRPRDPVGALAIAPADHGGPAEIWARSSSVGRGARYRLVDGTLHEVAPVDGFPFCPGHEVELVPGRNYAEGPGGAGGAFLARRCRDDLVDERGRRLHAEATVGVDGTLSLTVTTRCPPGATDCPSDRTIVVDGAGVAMEIDDVDRDGRLEVITSAAGAPGDADAVIVRRLGPLALVPKPLFKRGFSGGIVALGSGDVDGDGDRDVFAAVRLAGARKVDLWLLD